MNIMKRELSAGLKPFIFWSVWLLLLVTGGMVKFTGVDASGASVNALIEQFPRVVLAALGMVGINIETLDGYYAVLAYFALVSVAIYGVYLGASAVNREAVDKTYEFVFTKPRSRRYILRAKLDAASVYLVAFCALNAIASFIGVAIWDATTNTYHAVALFSVAVLLIGVLFFALGAACAACTKRAERGMLYGNLAVMVAFIMGMLSDTMVSPGMVKWFSPLKYFAPWDVIAGKLDPVYIAVCIVIAIALIACAFWRFEKKDLTAV